MLRLGDNYSPKLLNICPSILIFENFSSWCSTEGMHSCMIDSKNFVLKFYVVFKCVHFHVHAFKKRYVQRSTVR